ncbi:hypothetical protein RFI_17318, partial [Reticulomyxa filosa]
SQKLHERKGSGLIKNVDSVEQLDPFELEQQRREMHQQLHHLLEQETHVTTMKEYIIHQLQLFESKQQDMRDEVCLFKYANKWNEWEVALKLRKEGLDEYAVAFVEKKIDGATLLYDLTDQLLLTEFGVKKIHLSKFRRITEDLKKKSLPKWDQDVFSMATFIPSFLFCFVFPFRHKARQSK